MVVLRALAKNPDDRYQSADEMEADLERVARGANVSAATVDTATQVLRRPTPAVAESATAATMIAPPASAGTRVLPPPVVAEEEYEERGGPERPLWPWLVAIGFVVAAVIAGFFVWQELSGSAKQVPVALYLNQPVAQAKRQIVAAHLKPRVQRGSSDRYRRGIVFKQDPSAGSHVDKGSTVTIWVSTGPPKVSVPDVKGDTWAQAQTILTNAGLQPRKFGVPGNTKDQVTATDPPAGKSVPKGTTVRVSVMNGPQKATVPSVVGLSLSEATSRLNGAGFNANPKYVDSTAPKDQVVSQNPTPGSSEPKGSSVTLQVSIGPPQVSVPDVVGYTSQQAVLTLQRAGFTVVQQPVATGADQDNIVQSQSPNGGSSATKGSQVTIVVGQHSPGPPPPPPTTTTTG
jgi:eukaryotic-like serine/threonine-protein kinase